MCDSIYVKRGEQGWEGWGNGVMAEDFRSAFWGDENVLKLIGGGGCTPLGRY